MTPQQELYNSIISPLKQYGRAFFCWQYTKMINECESLSDLEALLHKEAKNHPLETYLLLNILRSKKVEVYVSWTTGKQVCEQLQEKVSVPDLAQFAYEKVRHFRDEKDEEDRKSSKLENEIEVLEDKITELEDEINSLSNGPSNYLVDKLKHNIGNEIIKHLTIEQLEAIAEKHNILVMP